MNYAEDVSYQLLEPLDRAYLFRKLVEQGFSQSALARKIGKSLSFVSNTLRLLKLPLIIQEGLVSNTISEGHARALLSIKTEDEMIQIYQEILVTNANVRQTEELVRNVYLKS